MQALHLPLFDESRDTHCLYLARGYYHQSARALTICLNLADETWDHKECRADLPDTGCPRCGPKPPGLCCDIHSKDAFLAFYMALVQGSESGAVASNNEGGLPARSIIKLYTPTAADSKLLESLMRWRDTEHKKSSHQRYLLNSGPIFIFLSLLYSASLIALTR